MLPLFGKLVDTQTGGPLEASLDRTGQSKTLQDFADFFGAVLFCDVIPNTLSASIRIKSRQIIDRWEVIAKNRLAHVHIGYRIPSLSSVLGEPFVEPRWKTRLNIVLNDGLE